MQVQVKSYDISKQFSYSKLATYSKCPRKAFYRYIEQLPEDLMFFVKGRAVHAAMEFDNLEKVGGRDASITKILERGCDVLEEEQKELSEKVDVDEFKLTFELQLNQYFMQGARDLVKPVQDTIEGKFLLSLLLEEGPAELTGYIDVVSEDDQGRFLVDYKTGQRPVYAGDARRSPQFQIYRWGSATKSGKVINFVAGERQHPACKVTEIEESNQIEEDKTLTWIAQTIAAFRKSLKSGDWPMCAPECYWCAFRICSFYPKCYPAIRKRGLITIPDIRLIGTLKNEDGNHR